MESTTPDRATGYQMSDGSTCFDYPQAAHVIPDARHRWGDWRVFTGGPWCVECRKAWPCLYALQHTDIKHWRVDESAEDWQTRATALMPAQSQLFSPSSNLLRMARNAYDRGDLAAAHEREASGRMGWDGGAIDPPYYWTSEHFDAWAEMERDRLSHAAYALKRTSERQSLWKRAAAKIGLKVD